ncbi:phage terminase small subunit P27 family [Weissella viridescens]|jgi:P27 family predicted phage terminase small subunit|uniref:Phage terminase, small subunit n=1 Tax=Weissella viridescens TaxID=1629 RepID=A0A0R2H7U2_WEIVI|nr:phage terminase small subunit P27 family [Weissella viridescens]KRN46204.1 hypothetical protein IV50_GL001186 [Weissella viridescens]SUP61410.1 Phage terminase, small subunit [Weissella viridescens]DAJ62467.1 MAG TPA: terminase small subunit [Caudoviricetes sp.]
MTKGISNMPPRYLKGEARNLWQRLVPVLKENFDIQLLDKTLIESICINYDILRRSYAEINDEDGVGIHYWSESGMLKSNPAIADIDRASKNIKAGCEALGMTPKTRSEIMALMDDTSDDDTDFMEELRKMAGG